MAGEAASRQLGAERTERGFAGVVSQHLDRHDAFHFGPSVREEAEAIDVGTTTRPSHSAVADLA